ncbi:PREDICTED: exportin-5 [Papilio polytes]|uniref:exportin-5 n=1 Tax=Papilio polytes TaxID=76194 RepID=UPI00067675FA|nr:PREDICTED: exportin-5 [Papilio polytes]
MNVEAVNGDMAGEVGLIADELSRAVELTLNAAVSHDARNQAYNACESFKENSPWCAQAGLLLASGSQYSAVVKHFGLQLMEHTVKYRWTQITQAEKIFIKENAMKLLYMGGWETGHLNDALARVIVEMIKREWPQQWPTLLAELSDACSHGHLHTQIVLHVFLRLVEDVATLQTLEQHQRRKDIYQALTSNMAEIFAFFMRLIELHVQEFREKTTAGDYAAAASNGRVVQVVLLTLTGFVEWVSTNHVVMNDGRLLQILCILLQDEVFRLPAAECLLQVVNRKGSTKERKPLMILFSEDAISSIHRAALASIGTADEKQYLFLKKLSQVLAGLAQQLTTLWSNASNVEAWLPVLLETTLLLTSHPSLTLAHTANAVWLAFLKHDHISKLPLLVAVVPRWLQAAAPKVLKVSYPSSRANGVSDEVAYACMDYDSEQEFAIFFSRCRTEILDSFRYCMIAAPLVTWSYVEQWTQAALDKVHSCPPHIDITHPLHQEWEALSQVLDVVLSRLLQAEPCDCCTGLMYPGPGVGEAGAELLPRVLDKIFAALVYEGEPPEDRRSRSVKNVRRHAAGLLVKLGSKVLGDCSSRWAALGPHVSSAEALARLVGLDAPPAEDEERGRARSTLLHALTLLLGVVKRTHVPADPDKASRGGFGAGVTSSGNPIWRNPCSAHVLPLLPHALALARALHELHEPRAAALRHPAHRRALLPPPAERHNLLGLRDDAPPAPTEPQDRMQNYLHTLHDNVCHLVGAAAASLGRELYGAAGLARFVAGALLHAPACLPDHWLRRVLRAALRPLLLHCPPAHYADVAVPLLEHLAPFMLVHLSARWEYVTSLYESGKLEEEGGSESQEVLEDMLRLDEKLADKLADKLAAHHTKPPKIDKSKRDLFKKITARLIGRNVGQLFKKEVFILDLPTMQVGKEKARSVLDAPEGAGLESLFAPRAPT